MRSTGASPELIYAEFAKAATGAVNNTREFATMMKTKTSQDILLEARKSRLNDDKGIHAWLSDEHEGWTERPLLVGMAKELDYDAQHMNLTPEQAVDAFKQAHSDMDLSISLIENEILVEALCSKFFLLADSNSIRTHQLIFSSVSIQRT